MEQKEFIYFNVEAKKCRVTIACNGFPIINNVFIGKCIHSIPVNQYLAKTNTAQIAITPLSLDDVDSEIPTVKVQVRSYDQNVMSVSPESGKIIAQTELVGYTSQNLSFFNNLLDFSSTFKSLSPIKSENEIIEFANQLEQMFIAENGAEILKIFQPKLNEYAIAYYEDIEEYSEGFHIFLQDEFFPLGFMQSKEESILTSFIDKKVWRIGYLPDIEFIRSNPNKESQGYTINIYIGRMDDKFIIIR